MPKPANKTWGKVPCPIRGCTEQASIRRTKNHERGRVYLYCPRHNTIRGGVAEYLRKINEGPEPDPAPEPKRDPKREPKREPKKTSLDEWLWGEQ